MAGGESAAQPSGGWKTDERSTRNECRVKGPATKRRRRQYMARLSGQSRRSSWDKTRGRRPDGGRLGVGACGPVLKWPVEVGQRGPFVLRGAESLEESRPMIALPSKLRASFRSVPSRVMLGRKRGEKGIDGMWEGENEEAELAAGGGLEEQGWVRIDEPSGSGTRRRRHADAAGGTGTSQALKGAAFQGQTWGKAGPRPAWAGWAHTCTPGLAAEPAWGAREWEPVVVARLSSACPGQGVGHG